MSRGINKVTLIGNCTKDPETRYMPSGKAVTNIGIATSETWKDKSTGEKQESVEFHNLTFFDRLGEIAGEYLKKGSQIYVEGKLKTEKWQDKSGNDRYTTKIICNEMQMLGSKQDNSECSAPQQQPASAPQQPVDDGFDDSIPF